MLARVHGKEKIRPILVCAHPGAIEPRGCIASYHAGEGTLTLWSATQIPHLLRTLLPAMIGVAENKLRLNVDAIDEALLMEGLQKIANRITVGLVISSMIVGAALLMRIDTSFRILGYPGIAILFFLGAGIGAIILVSNILMNDLRAEKQRLRAQQRQKKKVSEPAPTG